MNVLLVYPFANIEWNDTPEEPRIPLHITYLGSAASTAGHNVHLLDLRVEQQKRNLEMPESFECESVRLLTQLMLDKISEEKIEFVGINCMYSGLFPPLVHLAKQVKAANPEIKISVGGIHPTIYPKEILEEQKDLIDYVVIGEGEKALVDILDHLSEENHSKIPEIDGVACYHNGKIVVNEKTNFIEDLDSLKFPSVNMLDISNYFTDTTGWHNPKGVEIKTPVPILSSRSCPKQCNFCSMHFVHGKTIRYRSPENVVTEMKYYINEFGLRYFNITDDNLTINKKKLIRLMDMIVRENLDIQFSTENGVFIRTLDEEAVDAMSDAGLVRLHMAFETGSDYIRNIIIGKGLLNKKIEELRQIFTKEKYFHIYLYGYFVIGFPEETEETLEETYQLIQSFPLDNLSLFYAIPFPGTSLYSQCERDGLFIGNHYYDPKSLVNMGSVGQMVKGDPNVQPYNLEISKLVAFREKVMKYLADTRTEADVPPSSPLRYDPSKPISYTQRIPIAMSA